MKYLAIAATLCVCPMPIAAQSLSGPADVIDGDTLAIRGEPTRIRLYGIDAPESQQTCEDAARKRYLCGGKTAEALATLIGRNGRVSCLEQEKDRYGRSVAVCEANGLNINAELVRQGWAIEYKQYSDGRYADEEADAQKAKRGLWAGAFVKPWEWRRGERLPSEKPKTADRACAIKGNISGENRIYHLPSSHSYEKTQIDEAKGERWFCSEDEAKAAGWRAAKR
jgi:endonuclease YncB( thermonuclease family)